MPSERFSLRYFQRGAPEQDSQRFRKRLASHVTTLCRSDVEYRLGKALEVELGVHIVDNSYPLSTFFERAELQDVLDGITEVYRWFRDRQEIDKAVAWHEFVARALKEQNLCYTLTPDGAVRYLVDEEFAANRSATLSALQRPELVGVLAAFEQAHRHLLALPQETKSAVRSMFEAVEIAVKLVLGPTASRLTRNLCKDHLARALAVGDATADAAMQDLCVSLGYWVDSAHYYRHGQGEHDEVAPTADFAVLFVANGAAFLRLIAARVPATKR